MSRWFPLTGLPFRGVVLYHISPPPVSYRCISDMCGVPYFTKTLASSGPLTRRGHGVDSHFSRTSTRSSFCPCTWFVRTQVGFIPRLHGGHAHLEERAPAPAEVPTVKSEAALYLDLPSVPMDADVLEWWVLNEMKFPALIVMARQYLGVTATSALAEHLFSINGRILDDLRQA